MLIIEKSPSWLVVFSVPSTARSFTIPCKGYIACFLTGSGACVAQRSRYGLPCDGPRFNSRSERCIYRASRPSQGTVNGGAVSK